MLCPSCGYDNIEGADRCEECLTSLFNLDESQGGKRTLARSVMEDDLSTLENEFLGVTPDTSAGDVVTQMKQARLGCALVLDNGKLVGIFTEVLLETDSIAAALNKMSMGHYRHIPVQKSDGSYCVTSIKHVLKYLAQSQW
jgi:hypothetical protein